MPVVELLKPHTHAGRLYPPRECIELATALARWLMVMAALVVADHLLVHFAQCELLPRGGDAVGPDPRAASQFSRGGGVVTSA